MHFKSERQNQLYHYRCSSLKRHVLGSSLDYDVHLKPICCAAVRRQFVSFHFLRRRVEHGGGGSYHVVKSCNYITTKELYSSGQFALYSYSSDSLNGRVGGLCIINPIHPELQFCAFDFMISNLEKASATTLWGVKERRINQSPRRSCWVDFGVWMPQLELLVQGM